MPPSLYYHRTVTRHHQRVAESAQWLYDLSKTLRRNHDKANHRHQLDTIIEDTISITPLHNSSRHKHAKAKHRAK